MRERTLLITVLSVTVAACTSVAPGTGDVARMAEPEPVDVVTWTGDLPIASPWLREQLPPGMLTYQRIPHPLALMAIPKGNTFDTALGSDANIRNLIDIQRGLAENLGVVLPPLRLLEHLRSPIETAAIGLPSPSVLVGATLSFRSDEAFEAFIAELAQLMPIRLAAPLDEEGFGQITGLPIPVSIQLHFEESTGRLAIYGSMVPDRNVFASLLEPSADVARHAMHALESRIDESGQGLFAWVDARQALQTGQAFSPELAQTLSATGADQIRAVAAGAGVVNGKGRLKLMADLGTDSTNRRVPILSNSITATTVGMPRNLFLLSVPAAAEFARLEALILSSIPGVSAEGWLGAKASFAEATGTAIEQILAAVGPELIAFSDRAGSFLGLRVRDPGLFDDVISTWADRGGVTIEERAVMGRTIRSVELPGTIGMPNQAMPAEAAAVLGIISRMRNRAYWLEDGDYLYLASAPQLLIDRISMGADTSVARWLDETQRIDLSSSLLAVTGSARNLPQTLYNGYIKIMQSVADLVGVEYDIWAMPTANQLRLPDRGTLGASINLGQPYVSLELSYESNPAEFLFGGGGLAAVAAAGIAAAIAIPAFEEFQDRVERADASGSDALFVE